MFSSVNDIDICVWLWLNWRQPVSNENNGENASDGGDKMSLIWPWKEFLVSIDFPLKWLLDIQYSNSMRYGISNNCHLSISYHYNIIILIFKFGWLISTTERNGTVNSSPPPLQTTPFRLNKFFNHLNGDFGYIWKFVFHQFETQNKQLKYRLGAWHASHGSERTGLQLYMRDIMITSRSHWWNESYANGDCVY